VSCQHGRDLGYGVLAPARGIGLDPAQPRAGCRAAEVAGAEQEGDETVGDLDGTIGQRTGGVGADQPDRAAAGKAGGGFEARQHVGRVHPLSGQQLGRQPGAGQPAGDVVLKVGVQAAVARLQLRRRAQCQHRAVQCIQAEPRDGLIEPLTGRGRPRLGGHRHRLLV
jgi:hypothetical protein